MRTYGRHGKSGGRGFDCGPVRRGGQAGDLSLTAGAVIVSLVLAQVSGLGTFLESLADAAGLAPAVFAPVLKTVGISILTRISSELCRDAGEGGLAAFVEMAGAVLALLVTAPLLQAVLDTLSGLL